MHLVADSLGFLDKIFALDYLKVCNCGRGGSGVARVGVTVHQLCSLVAH